MPVPLAIYSTALTVELSAAGPSVVRLHVLCADRDCTAFLLTLN